MKSGSGILLLVLLLAVLAGCRNQSILGKWRVVKEQGEMVHTGSQATFEFLSDGHLIISESKKYGTYTVDDTQSPHRIVFELRSTPIDNQSQPTVVIGIYKFENRRLIIKAQNDSNAIPPTDFTVNHRYALVELEPY